jgi:Fe-coproporphyrin III synthase
MIGISKLYCGTVKTADVLQYGAQSAQLPSHLLQFSEDKKPVVVWSVTRGCNLRCVHCYSNSRDIEYPRELDTAEGKALIDDLAAFGAPALRGLRICRDLGIKVGVRFAITKRNFQEIPAVFDLSAQEDIPRICFYHLVYAGRGWNLRDEDLTRQEARKVMDLLIDCTRELFEKGSAKEVLTVDNHCDGPYIYLRMLRENESRAADVLKLLKMTKGNNSGAGIGCVSWDGEVHPDQFWRNHSFGNIRKRRFSEIWMDTSHDLIAGLRDRRLRLKGRCEKCKWLDICGGNSRARAEAFYGDLWAPDPACYLTDEEIGIK